jgi:hypothetical protein
MDTTTTTDIQSRISKSTDSVLWFEARVDQQRAEHVDADRGAQSDRPERDNCQAARRAIWASPALITHHSLSRGLNCSGFGGRRGHRRRRPCPPLARLRRRRSPPPGTIMTGIL